MLLKRKAALLVSDAVMDFEIGLQHQKIFMFTTRITKPHSKKHKQKNTGMQRMSLFEKHNHKLPY